MKNYLEYIGDLIIQHIQQEQEIILVLPNKRPVAYLQQYIASQLNKPIWFPQVFTIEELVCELSGMQAADPGYTACCLYRIYKELLQDQADSFDDFLKWWNMLISDFNDIDMYLVDADSLFNYVNEAKAIDLWNPGQATLTELQQRYLSFWKHLPALYKQLNEQLSNAHLGYRGMLYRKAAANLSNNASYFEGKPLIFAGFNALSSSEENIIAYFLKQQQGFIYWEADEYYLNDKSQEAGKFLRYYKEHWGNYKNSIFYCNNRLSQEPKEIHISGAPKSMMQASYAGQLLKELIDSHASVNNSALNALDIALIPADESQLNPMLYQLPAAYIKQINISMGYPIISLPLYGLYELVFEMIAFRDKHEQALFNASLLHRFFSHPYFPVLCAENHDKGVGQEINSLKKALLLSGKITYDVNDLALLHQDYKHINTLWFFDAVSKTKGDLSCVLKLLNNINDHLSSSANIHDSIKQLLQYQLSTYNQVLLDIHNIFFVDDEQLIKQSKTLLTLITQGLQSSTVPFLGNATGGVQFIGLLETRMLHFDELIITGCNEGILPGAKAAGNSFIPFDIRLSYQLPTYRDSEAVFAYHFYRLLQGAKKIHLIYNTETDEFGSGERSRFLSQIEKEIVLKNKQATVRQSIIKLPEISGSGRKSIRIAHQLHLDKINNLLVNVGLSPTALTSYKNCSLKFYFKYIEKIKEPDEIADEVGANIVGNVIHHVLEDIYLPLVSKEITAKDITYTTSALEQMTVKAFEIIQVGSYAHSGKNLLFIQTAVRIISKYLNDEIEQLNQAAKISIMHIEEKFKTHMKVRDVMVLLQGKTDRIDKYNGAIRIIDYKTGSVDKKKLKIETADQLFMSHEYDKAFQLMFYRLLFDDLKKSDDNLITGILSLRKISDGLNVVETEDVNELMKDFRIKLNALLEKLLDEHGIFEQTDDIDVCAYCEYKNICMK